MSGYTKITQPTKKQRDSNIELLRILLMFMILMLHGYGITAGMIERTNNLGLYIPEGLIYSLTVIAVNCYIFISGYFGMKFNLHSFLSLITQLLFYSLGIVVVMTILGTDVSSKFLLRSIFPVSGKIWWFMSAYVALYLVAPFLNAGLEKLTKKQFQFLIFGLIWLNTIGSFYFHNDAIAGNGYSFFNFVVVYFVARYIKLYNVNFRFPFVIYLGCTLFCFAIDYFVNVQLGISKFGSPTGDYANPLQLLAATAFFLTFKNIKPFFSKFINKVAKLALAVYLIHVNGLVWGYFIGFIKKYL